MFIFDAIAFFIFLCFYSYPVKVWFIFVKDWKGGKMPVYWRYLWFVFQLPAPYFIIILYTRGRDVIYDGPFELYGIMFAFFGACLYMDDHPFSFCLGRKRFVPKKDLEAEIKEKKRKKRRKRKHKSFKLTEDLDDLFK